MNSGSLFSDVLRGVSRSFYLTLRAVPASVRRPLGLAYLLARLTDSLADTAAIPAAVRATALEGFCQAIDGGDRVEILRFLRDEIAPIQSHPHEQDLILRAGECIDALDTVPKTDRDSICDVLRKITHGQSLDVSRFGDNSSGAVSALQTAGELNEYTYLVAGSVGEFWTVLGFRHFPHYASRPQDEMMDLGVRFGKALQLVNILRDLPADLRDGRCYLPATEIQAAGILLPECPARPDLLRPVRDRWLAACLEHFDAAWFYTRAVQPRRVRFACALPVVIGWRTACLLRGNEIVGGVKVDRGQIRSIAWRCAWSVFSDFALQRLQRKERP